MFFFIGNQQLNYWEAHVSVSIRLVAIEEAHLVVQALLFCITSEGKIRRMLSSRLP